MVTHGPWSPVRNGMLGGHLVRRLHRDGHQVRGVDLREPAEPLPGVSYTVADVRDAGTMADGHAGADAVIHSPRRCPATQRTRSGR